MARLLTIYRSKVREAIETVHKVGILSFKSLQANVQQGFWLGMLCVGTWACTPSYHMGMPIRGLLMSSGAELWYLSVAYPLWVWGGNEDTRRGGVI